MARLLEKAIKDAFRAQKCTVGTKEVIKSIKNSKLVVLSRSIKDDYAYSQIVDTAKNQKVPIIRLTSSSVYLGKLCGKQYRISAISLRTISDGNLKSILKEEQGEQEVKETKTEDAKSESETQ